MIVGLDYIAAVKTNLTLIFIAFPIIETIANDITEYIATNIISITDGQLYTNKKLFLDSCRPSIGLYFSFITITMAISIFLYWEPDILGNSDNQIVANPLVTPNNILPECKI